MSGAKGGLQPPSPRQKHLRAVTASAVQAIKRVVRQAKEGDDGVHGSVVNAVIRFLNIGRRNHKLRAPSTRQVHNRQYRHQGSTHTTPRDKTMLLGAGTGGHRRGHVRDKHPHQPPIPHRSHADWPVAGRRGSSRAIFWNCSQQRSQYRFLHALQ